MNTLQKTIMRRIYYAYALRLLLSRTMLNLALTVLAAYLFARVVSVGSVVQNLMRVEVGQVDEFILSAFRNTDMLTLMLTILFGAAIMSLIVGMARAPRDRRHTWSAA